MYYERTGASAVVQADDTAAIGRILVVDDDVAFGRFMGVALEARGHDVDWAGSVWDALATLHAARYDLVVIDLRLPDGSGLALLREATEAGLLSGSAAVILTGHDFEEPCDIRVFRKPLDADLDPFLERVGQIVAITKRRASSRASGPKAVRSRANDGARSSRAPLVELVLYTSAASEKCQRAMRTVRHVLSRYERDQVHFTVIDLSGDPDAGDQDAVVFTPTLVKRGPGSRTYIVGNLDDPELVTDLLDVSGVRRVDQRA